MPEYVQKCFCPVCFQTFRVRIPVGCSPYDVMYEIQEQHHWLHPGCKNSVDKIILKEAYEQQN